MRRQLEDNQELFGIVIPPACLGISNGISKKDVAFF
jgi:hypothetical protein